MPQPLIDQYRPTDDAHVFTLVSKILKEYKFEFNPTLDSDLSRIKEEYDLFYVVRVGGQIVGCVGVKQLSSQIAELKRLYLLPVYRSRDFGSMLLEKAVQYCLDQGFKKMVLDTTVRNIQAVRFFRKAGFIEVRREGEKLFFEKVLLT